MSNFSYSNQLSFPSYGNQNLPQRNIGINNSLEANQNRGNQQHVQPQQQHQVNQEPKPHENSDKSKNIRKNRPGQKFGAKKKSWVWSWFIQDSQDPNLAACDCCGRIIARLASDKGSPKKLSEHLKTHKLTKDSINYTRAVPIDGNGMTYNQAGEPLGIPTNYPPNGEVTLNVGVQLTENSNIDTSLTKASFAAGGDTDDKSNKRRKTGSRPIKPMNNFEQSQQIGFNSGRRFLSPNFENTPYSPMKFHKHLMKFLTENKLSINVIKSHSFQQLIYDLRSDSVAELLELTGLYSSLLEVSRFEGSSTENGTPDVTSISEATVASALSEEMNKK